MPTEVSRDEHAVAQTRDRKEFGDPLDDTRDDGLEEAQRGVHGATPSEGTLCTRHSMGETTSVRYLTIVRHAKAEKATPETRDFDRMLSDRGRRQCERLRAWVTDESELGRFGPTTALVSAAARTKETFQRAFEATPFVTRCSFSELIYNGHRDVSAEDLLIDLAAIDPVTTSLLVVGHNPTVLELLWSLVPGRSVSPREGFPTAGAFVLAIPDDRQVGLSHYDLVARYVPD